MKAMSPVWLEPLKKRLAEVIRPQAGGNGKAEILGTLSALSELLTIHRKEMPNELVHYLERRSYEKAARYCDEIKSE
jgi:hypothetical protein